jgi:hypothetical protein
MAPRPGGRGAGLLRPGQRAARAVAWTGLVVALLTVLVVAWPDAPVLVRAPVAVGFASLGAGAAVLSHRFSREPAVTWALVVLISLATFAAGMTALAWAGWWVPHPLVLAGAVAVAVSCAAALRRPAGRPARERPRPRWDRELPGHAAVLAVGVGLWLVALAGTDLSGVGGAGLLGTVHPAFFAALLLPVAGFLAALARPGGGRGPVLGGYLVLLVLVLHGTTPLLLDQPQYAWTYKHLGVVELLLSQGGITDSGDIYQQWPGLFAAVAGLSDLSGLAPASLADGSPVFFNLAGALVLLAIGRTLSPDRRVGYLTVLVFLCVNWVEEDYLSPQAFAFLLSLGGLLVVVRWLPRRPGWWTGHGPDRWRRWYVRLTAGIRTPDVPPRSRAAALAVLLLLFGVLTTTHQLSPFLLLGQLAVLVGLVLVRPWWTVPLLAGLAVGYLLPRFGLVTGSFDVFESLNFLSNAAGSADGWGSTGQAVSATVVRTLALTVWALAGLAVWRARHQLGRVLLPAVLAVTPFVLVAVQSYGGEAIYRVFLFSAPWSAYLIADLVLRARWQRAGAGRPGRVRRAVAWGLAGLLLAGAAVATGQGRHGQLAVDQQTTAEVAAARYLYAHAQPGATIALATPTFPSRLAGNYDQFNQSVPVGEPDLVEGAQLRDDRLDFRYLPAVENYLLSFGGTTSYLVVSDGMRQQADYFGHLPDGSLDALEATLASSRGWSVFYRNEDVVIYQFDAPAQSS